MKKIFFTINLFIFLFNFSCSVEEKVDEDEDTTSNLSIGVEMNGETSIDGYKYGGTKEVTATITPYEGGFKIKYSPTTNSGVFICSLSNYVVQNSSQKDFDSIAKDYSSFQSNDSWMNYDGYVESGTYDSCGTYYVETTWVVYSSRIGFDSKSNYQLILDDVTSDGYTAKTITITPTAK